MQDRVSYRRSHTDHEDATHLGLAPIEGQEIESLDLKVAELSMLDVGWLFSNGSILASCLGI